MVLNKLCNITSVAYMGQVGGRRWGGWSGGWVNLSSRQLQVVHSLDQRNGQSSLRQYHELYVADIWSSLHFINAPQWSLGHW